MTTISIADRLGAVTLPPPKMLIDGNWIDGVQSFITHRHPTTSEAVFEAPGGDATAVDRAITAARSAFDEGPWRRMPGRERARHLHRVAEAIRADADNLATLLSLDNATPVSFAGVYQMGAEYPADLFDTMAGWIDKITGETYPQ